MLRSGAVDGGREMAWTDGMRDWTPIGQIPELAGSVGAVPAFGTLVVSEPGFSGERREIEPGSEPLPPVLCLERGWQILKANASSVAVVFVVWFVLHLTLNGIGQALKLALGGGKETSVSGLVDILVGVPEIWLWLGLVRATFGWVDGKPVELSVLFGEGRNLLRALGATVLTTLLALPGLLLLIIPGIVIMLRLSYVVHAIVDRGLGVMDSVAYSWRLTRGNVWRLVGFGCLAILLTLGGLLLCGVGLLLVIPWLTVTSAVIFRWLQYGRRSFDAPLPRVGTGG